MEYNSKHPCDLCTHSDDCDIECEYGKRCGSYIGSTPSELCFDDEEDEEEY